MNKNTKNSGNLRRKPKRRKKKVLKGRIFFLMFLSVFSLVLVGVIKVMKIKAQSGEEFEKAAIQNQINKVTDKTINANRGSILDRNNQPLAVSSTVFNVALDIRVLSELEDEKVNKILSQVSKDLQIDIGQLNTYLIKDEKGKLKPENDTHWKVIKKKVPYDVGKSLEAKKLTGVHLEADTQRNYPQNNTASQTIGFIMGDTSWGLEKAYNDVLTGTPGRIYRTYENNNKIVTNDIEPIKGNDIVTTIDLTLQQYAEDIVENTYKSLSPNHTPENVSLVLMNPKTGEILSMAQYPDFNLNNPTEISLLEDANYKANFEKLPKEEQLKIQNSIWKNVMITDAFEPGSTFKAITVASAVEEGVISKNQTFYCSGSKRVADYTIRCHKRDGHGTLTLTEALEKSCNIAMLDIAEKMGRDTFYKYQRDFGYGYKTGIDLYGETSASAFIVPVDKLNVTELATSSFGQTFTATPIQIITSFAATINGGNLMKPYLVSQIIDENGNIIEERKPEIIRKVISEDTSDFLRVAMIETLEEGGTGYKANIPGYKIGGKTATAQQGKRSDNIYTLGFAAYLPAEDPEYLMLATISKPKDYIKAKPGTVSPVPMVKEFSKKIIEYKALPPSNEDLLSDKDKLSNDKIVLKDYINQSLKSVVNSINSLGLDFQIVGGGDTVVNQIPPPNTSIDKNGKVLLYVEPKDKNKELVSVPETKNLPLEEAIKLLEEFGFVAEVIEEVPETKEKPKNTNENLQETQEFVEEQEDKQKESTSSKKVFEQIPESGVFIEKGTTVKIKVK